MTLSAMSDRTMDALVSQVYRHTGITMDQTKRTMLVGRLTRRARKLKIDSLEDYLQYLKTESKEIGPFVDAVTTNKTSMFRSASVWKYLHQTWLPERESRPGQSLRAWSAACSTGQEAASIAILMADRQQIERSFRWQLDVSDVSPQMVATATTQCFDRARSHEDCARSPVQHVDRWLKPSGPEHVTLTPELRSNMRFFKHNLFDNCGIGRYDLVFVRNVIIYFSAKDRDAVIRRLTGAVRPGGLLVVGESESLEQQKFGLESLMHCVYQKPEAR
ncbi:MAG: protein-glutamate O-methyltransferase CheR [Myxococcota bacterium]